MLFLPNEELEKQLDYPALIEVLKQAFTRNYSTPLRHFHRYKNPATAKDSTLLLMPSWDNEDFLGVKLVTIHSENPKLDLPSIQGTYLLFDIKKGNLLMQYDAKLLTAKRTAATSALASKYLSRRDSEVLLVLGTGYLIPHLVEAHSAVRSIRKVLIWGRNPEKVQKCCINLRGLVETIEPVERIEKAIGKADIISTATMSKHPLIKGQYLRPGQHLDLVGSYLPDHREADDEVIKRASIFVDQIDAASEESGDLLIPLMNGILERAQIRADLFDMCKMEKQYFRSSETEITLFKSVGHALEDLAAASYIYKKVKKAIS